MDIFEQPFVLAVEKCQRSWNLSKFWPRYGQNKIKYVFQRNWNCNSFLLHNASNCGIGGGDGDDGVCGCGGRGVGVDVGGVGSDGVCDGGGGCGGGGVFVVAAAIY